jgi:phosphatidylglycerol:prolipoprotein diacylglycerol transferase
MLEYWQHIYDHFTPIAFQIGEIKVHWYGIMYILALVVGYLAALKFGKEEGVPSQILDEYVIWVEVGIILGARIGYFIFYVPHNGYYLTHPWEMFNPFHDGQFVGIRGMSYHGAIIGGVLATLLYSKIRKVDIWKLGDVAALAIPLGYIFGRIGNFLNQELYGRVTDMPWGIYVNGVLRHPSQLYEAFLEGVVLFGVIYLYRRKWRIGKGELISLYLLGYGVARFIAEFWRAPDPQLGFVIGPFTMGQVLSSIMVLVGGVLLWWRRRLNKELIENS